MTALTFGPPLGVRNTTEPYDDAALGDYLQDAQNCYFRDPQLLSGAQARPGFSAGASGSGHHAQGAHRHATGSTSPPNVNFMVSNGRLYSLGSNLSVSADVTPVAVTIDPSARVSFVSVGTSIIVTDGVNRPWIGTNLTSTPITGAYIDIDGAAGAWKASTLTVYQGSVAFLVTAAPAGASVTPSVGIVWSEPFQPAVGYLQSGYANFANIIEQSRDILYAIRGTNIGLFYWRRSSIGMLSGPLYSFTTTPTGDSRSDNVGSVTPWSIAQFGDNLFFNDQIGRAWMMPLTGKPQPIWKQMSAVVATIPSAALGISQLQLQATGVIIPEIDAYATCVWTNDGTGTRAAKFDVFDGQTGNYFGRWMLTVTLTTGYEVDILCQMGGTDGVVYFVLFGKTGDDCYYLNPVEAGVWVDATNTGAPLAYIETPRLGYAAGVVYLADTATTVTLGAGVSNALTVSTPYQNPAIGSGTAVAANSSSDSTYRTVFGIDICAARGMQFAVVPSRTTSAQWGFQRLEVPAVTSKAGPEDQ